MGKIVITGASSEIGLAITKRMADLGMPMLLQCFRNREILNNWENDAEVVTADFSDDDELDIFISRLKDVEILIYAAARTDSGLIPQIEEESLKNTIQVNITAYTKICQAIIPYMCSRRKGVIIGLSSVSASRVYKGQGVYAGSKAYMESFTKAIAAEYGRKGVRGNCVAPGSIEAGALKRLNNYAPEEIKEINALGKLGKP
ncbi:MAG: SDR family NAD(P)-dependent oxidoreductase [Bacteroidales bacterium]|nr:SDR family NAD(P)-dependent oxidoreductase [Bacteroidales bacterium]